MTFYKNIKIMIIVTSLLGLTANAFAITSFADMSNAHTKSIEMTLTDAVMLALRDNPALRQSEIQRISDKFALTVAEKEFEPDYKLGASTAYSNTVSAGQNSYSWVYNTKPEIDLKTHYGTQFKLASSNGSTNGTFAPTVDFSVLQPLIKGFGRPIVEAALNDAFDAELTNRLKFKSDVISAVGTVISDYLSLVQAYQTLRVDQQSLKSYQQTVANDRAMIAAGRMARSDIVQALSQVESQLSTIHTDQTSIVAAKNALLNDLGLPPQLNITVPIKLNFPQIEKKLTSNHSLPSLTESQDVALKSNIDYQTAMIAIRSLRRKLLTSEDSNRWQLDLSASEKAGGGGGGPDGNFGSITNGRNHAESVGLDLSIPIDDVSAQASIIDAKVGLQKAIIALKQGKQKLIEDVQTKEEAVKNAKQTLLLSQRALTLQERTVEIAQQKQLAGKISTFEVITQQQTLATQLQSVVTNQTAYLNSIVDYETQLGITLEPWKIDLKY